MLEYLVLHRGRSLSRDELLQSVWQLKPNRLGTRTIDMHVARLREKLGDNGSAPKVIVTVRGKGYMFQELDCDGTGATP